MLVLGLETSCDETGVALDSERGLLADALFSQIDLHRVYGGVVPELASRDHVKRMLPLIRQVLAEAGREAGRSTRWPIRRPGRSVPCWLVRPVLRRWRWPGACRRSVCITWKVICWRRCSKRSLRRFRSSPCWCLAGIRSWCVWMASAATSCSANRWTMPLARRSTRPPSSWACATRADRRSHGWPSRARRTLVFPRPMTDRPGLDFSFSGLKTFTLNTWQQCRDAGDDGEQTRCDIALAFQQAVVETLTISADGR